MTSQRHRPSTHSGADRGRPAAVAVAPPDDPVLRAAYDAVLDLGMRRTTLAEVARRASVSRMTVYRRYDDLDRLLSALLTEQLGAIVAEVERRVARRRTARDRAATAVVSVVAALQAHPLLTRVLDVDPETLLPLVVDRFGSSQRLARDHLAALLRQGMSRHGGDRSVRGGDADLMALTLVVAAQSFVFSGRVVNAADPRATDQLRVLVDRYLAPAPTSAEESR